MASVTYLGKLLLNVNISASAARVGQQASNGQVARLLAFQKAGKNLEKLVREVATEDSVQLQKYMKQYEHHGISKGEIRYANEFLSDSDMMTRIELLSDDKLLSGLLSRQELVKKGIISDITSKNKKVFIKLLKDRNISDEQLADISKLVSEKNLPIIKKLLKSKDFDTKILADIPATHLTSENVEILKTVAKRGDVSIQEMLYILSMTNKDNANIALRLLKHAGQNTEGIHCLLYPLRTLENAGEGSTKIIRLRQKFLSELLDHSGFSIGKTEMELFNLSEVLESVTPENYQLAQKALLEGNVEVSQLSKFVPKITPENKNIAERLLNMATRETKLPSIKCLDVKSVSKYLDEVQNIQNVPARTYYLEAMSHLRPEKTEKILQLIREAKPEDAKQVSAVITCLNRGLENAEEIRSMVRVIEQSGRNFDNYTIANLIVLAGKSGTPEFKMLTTLLENKTVPDSMVNYHLEDYIELIYNVERETLPQHRFDVLFDKYTKKCISDKTLERLLNNAEKSFDNSKRELIDNFPELITDLYKNKNLSGEEIQDICNQVTLENFNFVKKYAQSPILKKVNLRLVTENTSEKDIDTLLSIKVPKSYQSVVLPYIQKGDAVSAKRVEIAQQLAKKEDVFPHDVETILAGIDEDTLKYSDEIFKRSDLSVKQIAELLEYVKKGKGDNVIELLQDSTLSAKNISKILKENIFDLYKQYPNSVRDAISLKVPLVKLDDELNAIPVIDILGESKYKTILQEIQKANSRLGIKSADEELYLQTEGADNLFITLSNLKYTYKFNRKTGKLISAGDRNKIINFKTNTVVQDIIAQEPYIASVSGGGNVPPKNSPYLINTIQKSKKGEFGLIYSESDIKGQYDIFRTKTDGSRVKIGHAQITPNGAKHIRRNLTSIDGSRSYLAYREDKIGNSFYHSVIKDNTGKQISEVKRTFKVLSKNHFRSTYNGRAYDIVFHKDKVVVTKLNANGKKTKDTVEYAIQDVSLEDANNIIEQLEPIVNISEVAGIMKQYGILPRVIDRSCADMLKRLPGDEWFAMSKTAEFVLPQSKKPHNACYCGNSIFMSKELADNLGVFAHELGHAKVHTLNLLKDKKLIKIYNTEKEAFTSKRPKSRVDIMDYLLSGTSKYPLNGLDEMGADTNLVSTTIQSVDFIKDRTIFAEQDFPQTMAYIRNKYETLL